MDLSLIICCGTALGVFLSVLFKPYFHIGHMKFGTYWVISAIGAISLCLFGNVPMRYLFSALTNASSINPLQILILFFSMTAMSVFLDEIGFFCYLANVALHRTKNSQMALFCALYAIVSILTVFTSNDIVVLTFTPFICFFAKNANISPMPYLFAEFVASNTWSMFLIIGNPTNIYLASSAGVDFLSYVKSMALPTVFAGTISFLLLWLLFRRDLAKPMHAIVAAEPLHNRSGLILGVGHLGLCTILLAISSYLAFEMYLIAASFALSLFICAFFYDVIRHRPFSPIQATFARLPYELIPFVLSMFILVLSLDYTNTTTVIAQFLSRFHPIFGVGLASFLCANVINNIPMSVLFSSILATNATSSVFTQQLFAAVIGSNLGAFFTPVGALAGMMWMSILKRFDIDFSFRKFVGYGAILSIPTLLSSLLGLWIVL